MTQPHTVDVPDDLASRLRTLRAWSEVFEIRLLDARLAVQRRFAAGEPVDCEAIDHLLALCERLDDAVARTLAQHAREAAR